MIYIYLFILFIRRLFFPVEKGCEKETPEENIDVECPDSIETKSWKRHKAYVCYRHRIDRSSEFTGDVDIRKFSLDTHSAHGFLGDHFSRYTFPLNLKRNGEFPVHIHRLQKNVAHSTKNTIFVMEEMGHRNPHNVDMRYVFRCIVDPPPLPMKTTACKLLCSNNFIYSLVKNMRVSDKRMGRDNDLGVSNVREMVRLTKGCCAITHIPFATTKNTPFKMSIDRIDDNLGHVVSNCRLIIFELQTPKGMKPKTVDFIRSYYRDNPKMYKALFDGVCTGQTIFDAPTVGFTIPCYRDKPKMNKALFDGGAPVKPFMMLKSYVLGDFIKFKKNKNKK